MAIEPRDWSAIVIGHWNRAILTPAGIVRRLFGLPETTPVEVEIALDAFLPYRVRHGMVTVTAGSDKLHVQPVRFNYAALAESMRVASEALRELPETPVFAAGFNVNFRTVDDAELLTAVTSHQWDDRLSDEHFAIDSRSITRSLVWGEGRIRVTVAQEADASFLIQMNYDRRSTSAGELRAWLGRPVEEVREKTERILTRCLGLALGDIRYVNEI